MVASHSDENILEAHSITKTFPGVCALNGVHFSLRKGEVHAVIGENGAGKSTLIHILGGIFAPDEGEIHLEGNLVHLKNPHYAALHGIGVVFQELSLVESLSIAENIFANRQPLKGLNLIDRKRLYGETEELLGLFELNIDPGTPVKYLSAAHCQTIEILKALSHNPHVLILDEPTSSLTSVETERLFAVIKGLVSDGMSCIYISHHLPEIFEVADRVTVLRDGERINTCNVEDVNEEKLITMMVGRELSDMFGVRSSAPGDEYVCVDDVGRGEDFNNVSFTVRKGEIIGLAGLVGAGRTELGRALFGMEPLERGCFILDGATLRIRSPHDAIAHGIAYVSEDRKTEGLFSGMTVRENSVAPQLRRFAGNSGFLHDGAITRFANRQKELF